MHESEKYIKNNGLRKNRSWHALWSRNSEESIVVTEGEAAKVIKWLPEMTRVLAPVCVPFYEPWNDAERGLLGVESVRRR